jgi:von Hippel-Lindau disease tumor suppressor protein
MSQLFFRGCRNPLLLLVMAAGLIVSACLPGPAAITASPSMQTPELTLSPVTLSVPTAISTVTPLPTAASITLVPSSSANCSSLRSVEGSTLISVTFVNRSKDAVNVNWITYQGSEQFYFDLQPGQSQRQETYVTHAWCVRDKWTNAAILAMVATQNEQVATVPGEIDCTSGWTRLKAGRYSKVSQDQPVPNRVREGPDTSAKIIYRIDPGEILRLVEGPICSNGLIFWKVESTLIPGGVGWTTEGDGKEYYLEPIE